MLLALACVGASWRSSASLPPPSEARAAAGELARGGVPRRPDWVRTVLHQSTPELADAELREQLLELKLLLHGGRHVPRAAARVALAQGTGLCVLGLSLGLGRPGVWDELVSTGAFVAGAVGAMLCTWVGRRAEQRVNEAQTAYQALAASLRSKLAGTEGISQEARKGGRS